MKLLIPVAKSEDILMYRSRFPSLHAEYYTGFSMRKWDEKFGVYEDLNRMTAFRSHANLEGLAAVKACCDAVGDDPLYVTLNAPAYTPAQELFLTDVLSELSKMPVAGIILGDPMLVKTVRAFDFKAIASTMLGVYHADLASHYVSLGFSRIILPRDLTLAEIRSIQEQVPEAEYECFLMRNGCRYSDSNCLAMHHHTHGALCGYLDCAHTAFGGAAQQGFVAHDAALFNHKAFAAAFHKSACGMCAVWDLVHMGITAGKLVGRADGAEAVVDDIAVLIENIGISMQCSSRAEYLKRMRMPKYYDNICYLSWNCYYPEVRYPLDERSKQ